MANVPPSPAGHVNKAVLPNPPAPMRVQDQKPQVPIATKKPSTGVTHILLNNGWIPVESLNFTQDTTGLNAQWLQLGEGEYAFVAMSENKMLVGKASAIIATKSRG